MSIVVDPAVPTYWDKLATDKNLPRRISNSEASAYLQCERKWFYGYKENLEPVSTSTALSRGIIGHECLAAYYTVLMTEPHAFEKATRASDDKLAEYLSMAGSDKVMLFELETLLDRYYALARADGWTILAVEQSYDIDVNDEFGYVMRLDLLANIKGKNVLVDHKIIYAFYNENDLDMNCQMPKYIGALRHNGIQVDYAILNMIRHRQKKGGNTDEETFQRVVLRPSALEIKNVMREQFKASKQVVALHANPDAGNEVLRTMNQMTCKNCSFLRLCKTELMGEDASEVRATSYRQNAYNLGYNNSDEEV